MRLPRYVRRFKPSMSFLLSWHHWTFSCRPQPRDNWTSSTWDGSFYRYFKSCWNAYRFWSRSGGFILCARFLYCLLLLLLFLLFCLPCFLSLYADFTLYQPNTQGIWNRPSRCVLLLFEHSFVFSVTLCHCTSMVTILTAHQSHPRLSACLIVTA